jgi:hypothetical protein
MVRSLGYSYLTLACPKATSMMSGITSNMLKPSDDGHYTGGYQLIHTLENPHTHIRHTHLDPQSTTEINSGATINLPPFCACLEGEDTMAISSG